jgi:hypothetical protein
MCPHDDPADLSPDGRRAELASIFAAAILRLHARAALAPDPDSDAGSTCLEVPSEAVLSDHHG